MWPRAPFKVFGNLGGAVCVLLCIGGAALAEVGADGPPVPPWEARLYQSHPLVGRVFAPRTGGFVAPSRIVERLGQADFVLLGEKHDNPDHHKLQAWLTQVLVGRGRRPALVLEMIDTDRASAVSAHLRDHPGDAAGLGTAVAWEKTGWPEWGNYRPIVEAVLAVGLPVVPGNLPRDMVRRLGREGLSAMDADTRKRLGLDRQLPAAVTSLMAREIRDSHCRLLPEAAVPAMVDTQRSRDGSLAAAMTVSHPNSSGAILIAGAGHARTDWGVPAYLRESAPGKTIASVAFLEVDDDHLDAGAYAERFGAAVLPFDLVWFTPRQDDEDPCARMAEHMKKKK